MPARERPSRRAIAAREATSPVSSWRSHSRARCRGSCRSRVMPRIRVFLAAAKSMTTHDAKFLLVELLGSKKFRKRSGSALTNPRQTTGCAARSRTELDAPQNAEPWIALDGLELTDCTTELFPSCKHARPEAVRNEGARQDGRSVRTKFRLEFSWPVTLNPSDRMLKCVSARRPEEQEFVTPVTYTAHGFRG